MRVLVLGSTGYIGSALTERLAAHGHQVVSLVRPDRTAVQLPQVHEVRRADLTVPGSLTDVVTPDIDAVVHVATPSGDAAVDAAAIAALLDPLRGSGRAFIYTSGVWVLGATGAEPLDEDSPTRPIELVRDRPAIEQDVLAAASAGTGSGTAPARASARCRSGWARRRRARPGSSPVCWASGTPPHAGTWRCRSWSG